MDEELKVDTDVDVVTIDSLNPQTVKEFEQLEKLLTKKLKSLEVK